jgi:hypothetical protein
LADDGGVQLEPVERVSAVQFRVESSVVVLTRGKQKLKFRYQETSNEKIAQE